MNRRTILFHGKIGLLPVIIEQEAGTKLKVSTTIPGASKDITITGETASELEKKLFAYGAFTRLQVAEIVHKLRF
jgi:hypothetical protein